jgi:hypothetical protein
VEVSTGDALAAAVANAAVRLILLRGPAHGGGDDGQGTYILPSRCTIDATRTLDISCVPSSSKDGASAGQRGVRIVGPWKVLNHSRFTVTGVTLEGVPHPRWKRPVISAMNASTVTLRDCCVRGGREGIHLAGKSHGLIWNTTFTDNARGIFESFECGVQMRGCTFAENLFHHVLLGDHALQTSPAAREARIRDVAAGNNTFDTAPPGTSPFAAAAKNESGTVSRADVCFDYNPVKDRHSALYTRGIAHELPKPLRSAGLVDPTW